MQLAAVPLDINGNAIHGLAADWESDNPQVVSISNKGEAVAGIPGKAQITASAGSKQAQVKFTVTPPTANTAKAGGNKAVDKVSGARKSPHNGSVIRASKGSEQKSSGRFRQYAHRGELTGSSMPQGGGRDPGSLHVARNAVGNPPNKTTPGAKTRAAATEGTETPGSSNFNFSAGVVSLPGRGLDINLSAFYNSRIWNRVDSTEMNYDQDQGWPAPGFRLGYGKLTWNGTITRSWELVDPDGTRHQMLDPNVSPQPPSYTYDSADGTFTHLTATAGSLPGWPTPTAATYPDGTQVLFGAPSSLTLTYYPTQIIDRQGNTVLISYLNGEGPRISSIQDTLLRHIYFKYVGDDLVAITAPGLTDQADLPVIRFYYSTPDIPVNQTGLFQSGITVNAPATAHVISYIYLPSSVETNDAHIGYRYYYSAYGMIYQIAQFRGMTISTAANDYTQAGTVSSEGIQAALTTYNYQGTPVNPTTGLADAPYYTTRTDEWAGRVSAQPPYTFVVDPATGVSTVTAPDNSDPALRTATETHTIVDSGQWDDGLISETKIKVGSTVLSDTLYTWDPGPGGFNARLKQVKTTNEANQTRATVFTYDTADLYNNVWKVSERDLTTDGSVSPTELRRTETIYQTGSQYTNRGLIHLPATVKVFKPGASTPASQTNYSYDDAGQVILTAPSDVGAMYTNPQNSARGDLTIVTQYADAANPNGPAGPISHSTNYDSMGNVTLATVDCCQQKTFSYSSGYFYAYPTSVTSGAGPSVTTTVTYDLHTGLVVTVTDQNNQATTTTNAYFVDSLRPEHTDFADGGAVYYHYNDNLFTDAAGRQHYFVNTSTRLDASRIVDSYRFFDGRGAVTQTFDNWTNANGWSTQDLEYDVMERPYHSGNPYYCGGYGWAQINPTGLWTTRTFDNLGRVTRVDMPSGDAQNPTTTNVQSSYAGTVTTVTDQASKQRRQIIDALGRVVRLDEPGTNGNLDANGVPVQSTAYEYDILDNLIHITQDAQQRFFKYDSLSRLTYERQVEQDAPWTTTDSVAGNSQWSRKIIYNSQSLVQDAYDARQINTHFVYDGLNRVSQINYNLQSGSPDPATPSAYYWYDSQSLPNGAPVYNHGSANGRLIAMTYGGVTATTGNYFGYDQMGRVNIQRQVTGANVYSMGYGYNVAGELLSETYNSGRVTNYAYDEGGRLSSVTDGLGASYDSGYTYAPHGGLSSETFGNGAVHSMNYNNALQASEIKLKQSANGAELQRYNYSYGQVDQATGAVNTTKNNGQIGRIDASVNGATTKEWDQRFLYDSLGRLSTAAEYKQGDNGQLTWQAHYDYDRYGNRFQYQNNVNLSYTQVQPTDINQATNRFISNGSTPVVYDNGTPGAGNITSDSKFRSLSYTYDANNRQTSASGTGINQTSVYDCAGQRVQTTANGVTRTMVYDIFGQDIADYLGASGSTLEREYIYRSGQLLATTTSFSLGIGNAGFETPALGAGAYQYNPTGAAWTFAGNSGVTSNGSGFTYANPNAPEGNQVGFLQGGSASVISQSIAFQAGVTYTLTFSAAQRPCCATSQDFQVYLDNTLLGTFHPSGTSYADYSTGTFTTTAGAHVLKFVGLNSNGGDNTAFIDKVRIGYAAPSVVSAGNAGFETPALGAGAYQYGPTGAAWTFAGGSGVSNNGSGFTWANPNAPEGNQVGFLQGGSASVISQSISGFQAGVTYTLTFSAAQRPCCATSQDFQVYLDNTLLGTFHPSGTSYAEYSTGTFTTTAGAHVLKFAGLNSNGGDNTAFIDNVRLTGAGASTGETNYVLQDIQGSTRAVMNSNGSSSAIIARHDYLPFGEEIGSLTGLRTDAQGYGATDTNRQKYGLTERDDTTALDHTLWRKYESRSGRWTSPDPLGGNIGAPQSFNRYAYTQNDPVNFVDPSGLDGKPGDLCPGGVTGNDGKCYPGPSPPVVIVYPGPNPNPFLDSFFRGLDNGAPTFRPILDYDKLHGRDVTQNPLPTPQPQPAPTPLPRSKSDQENDEAWSTCVKLAIGNQFGVTDLLVAAGIIPVSKAAVGLPITPGASRFTNVVSYLGHELFPGANLPFKLLGTNRIFGIAGRASPYATAALLAYDIYKIAEKVRWCNVSYKVHQAMEFVHP
jgi:RHS repeat-associated protein